MYRGRAEDLLFVAQSYAQHKNFKDFYLAAHIPLLLAQVTGFLQVFLPRHIY